MIMPTFQTSQTNTTKRTIVVEPAGVPAGRITAADLGISPEAARTLQDWAGSERRKLELLLLVARLRDLMDRRERIVQAAGAFGPEPTPQYLQLNGQIAQAAERLAQAGVYDSPGEAMRDAERWLNRKPPMERFQGQPVVALTRTPVQYSIYTAAWGAETPKILSRVEQALNEEAARRRQRSARTR